MTTPPQAQQSLYELLGVPEDAELQDIRKAARKLLQAHHPDRGGDPEVAAAINAAASVLTDPDKRAAYDAQLHAPANAPEDVAPPDPDTFEDDWGQEAQWDAEPDLGDDDLVDEEIDGEIVDDPAPAPSADGSTAVPSTPTERPTRTPVHSPARAAGMWGAGIWCILAALVTISVILAPTGAQLPWLSIGAGALVGVILAWFFARKSTAYPGHHRARIAAVVSAIITLVPLTLLARTRPDLGLAVQAFVPSFIGAWITLSGLARQRSYRHFPTPRKLRTPGMMFGPSSGTATAEMTSAMTWEVLAQSDLAAARAFQTSDAAAPYEKSIVCGNRIALVHGVVLPAGLNPNCRVYWSEPSVFLMGPTGIPSPIARQPHVAAFREGVKSRGTKGLRVQEFVVVWQPQGDRELPLQQSGDGLQLVTAGDAPAVIADFLRGENGASEVVDYEAAVAAARAVWMPPRVP